MIHIVVILSSEVEALSKPELHMQFGNRIPEEWNVSYGILQLST
jgi:hypothetical protein